LFYYLLFICVSFFGIHYSCFAQNLQYSQWIKLGKFQNDCICESSGITLSQNHEKYFWTHNDSGCKAEIFAIDKAGKLILRGTISNAINVDWEDICSYKVGKKSFLVIGDIGDNLRCRPFVSIYFLSEPKLPRKKLVVPIAVSRKISFSFEGGPTDCEALAVLNNGKTLLLAGKTKKNGQIYLLNIPKKGSKKGGLINILKGKRLIAKKLVKVNIPSITAMAISNDGLRIIISNYQYVFIFERKAGENWATAFKRKPLKIAVPKGFHGGEAICFDVDDLSLIICQEGKGGELWKLPIVIKSIK